jgi:hypothetical protein
MRDPIVRPRGSSPEASVARSPDSAVVTPAPASPSLKRRPRPGWKATIVRHESFAQLRAIQKSTTDPSIDLSYLTDACLRIALEMGRDAIVQRALADLRPVRTTSP